jgi:hypothetical protein
VHEWLAAYMIDEIDHRLTGEFKSREEWDKKERGLIAKYSGHPWAVLPNVAPNRWYQLHSYTNKLEMLHRADALFIAHRPHVAAGERSNEGALVKVRSMNKEHQEAHN